MTKTVQSEHITIRPATLDDIDELVKIHVDAFRPFVTTLVVNSDPEGQTADITRELQAQFVDPDMLIVKAVQHGVIVSWAAWRTVEPTDHHRIYLNGKSVNQRKHPSHVSSHLSSLSAPADLREPIETFWELIESTHQSLRHSFLARRRYMILATLVTAPAHQRHGLGEALTRWGLNKADEECLPCWVDCETVNISFYQQFEFAQVGQLTADLSRWAMGGKGANMGYGMWYFWAGLRLPRDCGRE